MAELNRFERMLAKAGGNESVPNTHHAAPASEDAVTSNTASAALPTDQAASSMHAATPLPGGNMIGFGWAIAGVFTAVALILLFVSLGQEGTKWSDNTAGDIVVMKQATFAVIWAVAALTGGLLAVAGHIVRGFARMQPQTAR